MIWSRAYKNSKDKLRLTMLAPARSCRGSVQARGFHTRVQSHAGCRTLSPICPTPHPVTITLRTIPGCMVSCKSWFHVTNHATQKCLPAIRLLWYIYVNSFEGSVWSESSTASTADHYIMDFMCIKSGYSPIFGVCVTARDIWLLCVLRGDNIWNQWLE